MAAAAAVAAVTREVAAAAREAAWARDLGDVVEYSVSSTKLDGGAMDSI